MQLALSSKSSIFEKAWTIIILIEITILESVDEFDESYGQYEVDSDVAIDQSDAEEDSHMTDSDQSEASSPDKPGDTIATISLASLQEDIEKGKEAKHQLGELLGKSRHNDICPLFRVF